MKLSRNGTKLVIDFEGKHKKLPGGRYQAYKCPADVWTIYTGITEGVHDGMIVTEAEGMAMFRKEIAKFEDTVNQLVKVEVNQNQFDALVSFAYNCGSGALAKSGLLKKMNKGDFDGAAAEFHKWNKGGGKVLPGLVRRRAAEAELFQTPVGSVEPAMPQAVDAPATAASTLGESRSIWAGLMGLVSIIAGVATDLAKIGWDWIVWLLGIAPTIYAEARDTLTPMQEMAGWFGKNIPKVTIAIAVVCIVTFLVRHAMLRVEAKG